MKKIIYKFLITLFLILILLILYLSTIGIKTNRFNDLIISEIKEIEPSFDLRINDVSAKLNVFSLTINVKTLGTDLIYNDKIIELQNILSKISIKSLLNNKFALTKIIISTKSIPIKNLISLIRMVKKDPKLLIVEQFVDSGYIIADLKFDFDESGKINKNYIINGLVNDGYLSLPEIKISKLNFIFQISEKELNINDAKFSLNNENINIPDIKVKKKKNDFLVSGQLKSKNIDYKKKEIRNLINNEFVKNNFKEIIFNLSSNFTFNIDKNLKIRNIFAESDVNIDSLRFKNFLGKNSILPQLKDEIIFKDQKLKVFYKKNKFEVNGSGNLILQNNLDNINYKVVNHKNKYSFDVNLNINDNPLKLDLLNYEKDEKSTLDLILKGEKSEDDLYFDEITFSENQNFLQINRLELSKDFKINDVSDIKIDYIDAAKYNNNLEIKKNGKNYQLIGNSFNADRIIEELLKSKKKDSQNFINDNFKLQIDIKKVFLDKSNMVTNLLGKISFNNNKITELQLESEFSKKQKIKFTINNKDGEKITTLFSNRAKPLVNRYKFIKGFSEGELDFYAIKKGNETNSILKIYDFKLKELPALTKILTLASLQGIADLLSGEGIRFNEFEMNFTNLDNLMTINEIYAIGPAISILMEGYIEKDNLISLRGTLVPATTINKTISSIPVLGDILVGKKVGEGVFGVSFKIKGPPKNLETSVNPIKTLTPRFITRTLEKIKKD
tara:strand:+ start:3471 stop:5657 length:2187 start_codon:yes stop_codon:yes gene_type:complete